MRFTLFTVIAIACSNSWAHSWGTGSFPRFAAIAYSQRTGAVGYSNQQPSQLAANQTALNYCGRWDCQVVAWVQNGCVALATGWPGYTYGWAYSLVSLNDAQWRAWNSCSLSNRGCYLRASICSN